MIKYTHKRIFSMVPMMLLGQDGIEKNKERTKENKQG